MPPTYVARPGTAPAGGRGAQKQTLDASTLNAMHRALFGGEQSFPPSWLGGFTFRESGMLCGLVQREGGPCGVLAAVQSFVLRELLLAEPPADPASVTREQAGEALLTALTYIIWSARVGRSANVVGCKSQTLPPLRDAAGELSCVTCRSAADVQSALRSCFGAYIRPGGPGIACLLYSLLYTRGVAMVARDADFPASLIAPNGYCSQELVNLLLVGRAHSNVFDGEHALEGSGGARLRGIPRRSPIGFLTLFERQGSLLADSRRDSELDAGGLIRVGANLKRPLSPIFVVQSEAHYSVLWAGGAHPDGGFDLSLPGEEGAAQQEAVDDEVDGYSDDFEPEDDAEPADEEEQKPRPNPNEARAPFDLLYYDQLAEREAPVRLTLRRADAPALEGGGAPLKQVILTRWPAADVDWNGEEVIL